MVLLCSFGTLSLYLKKILQNWEKAQESVTKMIKGLYHLSYEEKLFGSFLVKEGDSYGETW